MQIHEKLKAIRQCKGWTQEEIAEKLDWAVNSYAKIERGEADIKFDKLRKLAKILGMDVHELVDAEERTVLNFAENQRHSHNFQGNIFLTETQCAHELEKSQLIIAQKDKEIAWLQKEIGRLEEIIGLLKGRGTE